MKDRREYYKNTLESLKINFYSKIPLNTIPIEDFIDFLVKEELNNISLFPGEGLDLWELNLKNDIYTEYLKVEDKINKYH